VPLNFNGTDELFTGKETDLKPRTWNVRKPDFPFSAILTYNSIPIVVSIQNK
jgi:hypothetical protein